LLDDDAAAPSIEKRTLAKNKAEIKGEVRIENPLRKFIEKIGAEYKRSRDRSPCRQKPAGACTVKQAMDW
jgi:hypothetical protein